jgi:hypothetical protein
VAGSIISEYAEHRPFRGKDALERAGAWIREGTEIVHEGAWKYRCVGGSLLSGEGGWIVMATRNWVYKQESDCT